jgi:hypothetical protein
LRALPASLVAIKTTDRRQCERVDDGHAEAVQRRAASRISSIGPTPMLHVRNTANFNKRGNPRSPPPAAAFPLSASNWHRRDHLRDRARAANGRDRRRGCQSMGQCRANRLDGNLTVVAEPNRVHLLDHKHAQHFLIFVEY